MWKELLHEIADNWHDDKFIICTLIGGLTLGLVFIALWLVSKPQFLFIFVIFPAILWFTGYVTIRFLMWINNVPLKKKD